MDKRTILEVLDAAKGNDALLALSLVDLNFSTKSPEQREELRFALALAAVPHWFDSGMLERLVPGCDPVGLLRDLTRLSVVECFPARGPSAWNVHEASRRALRRHLRDADATAFRRASAAVVACMKLEVDHERIEALFHRFAIAPREAAAEWIALDQAIVDDAKYELRAPIATMLAELLQEGLTDEFARAAALLGVAACRSERGQTASLKEQATEALRLSKGHAELTSDAQILLGDVLFAQGDHRQAQAAFEASVRGARDLLEIDRSDTRKRAVAIALARASRVSQARGSLGGAELTLRESASLLASLAAGNRRIGFVRDYAVTLANLGEILLHRGELVQGEGYLRDHLQLLAGLAESHPESSALRRDLGIALARVADAQMMRGNFPAAGEMYQASFDILRALCVQEPSHAAWKRERNVSLGKIGELRLSEQDFESARAAVEEYVSCAQELADADPQSATARKDLAVALTRLGDLEFETERYVAAFRAFDQSRAIIQGLINAERTDYGLLRELAAIFGKLGNCRLANRVSDKAYAHYLQMRLIAQQLVDRDPLNANTRRDLGIALSNIGDVYFQTKKYYKAEQEYRKAITVFETLIVSDSLYPRLHRDLAISYGKSAIAKRRRGELSGAAADANSAIAHFDRAISMAPNRNWQQERAFTIQAALLGRSEEAGISMLGVAGVLTRTFKPGQ